MSTSKHWQYLEPRPGSFYRQLFIKGTGIRAEVIYGLHVNAEEPMTAENTAADHGLPVEAVRQAIAYCASNPPEVQQDFKREEALMEATGMNDPNYKYHPTPKVISPEERARILDL
jgi:uncharacterized protein (DUF433 family)